MADRDALADLRAEIHLWTGDESTPVDLRVLRAAAEEIERLRAALREAERKLDYADRESNPHDLADWTRGALEDVRRALENDRGE